MDRDEVKDSKAELPQLLDGVEDGETFTITKHGQPIAVPEPFRERSAQIVSAFSSLRVFRRGHRVGSTTIRELIADGRREID